MASVGEQGPGYAAYTEVFRSEVLLCGLCIKRAEEYLIIQIRVRCGDYNTGGAGGEGISYKLDRLVTKKYES